MKILRTEGDPSPGKIKISRGLIGKNDSGEYEIQLKLTDSSSPERLAETIDTFKVIVSYVALTKEELAKAAKEPEEEAKVAEKTEETEDEDDEVKDVLCDSACEARKVQSMLDDNLE